MNFDPTHPETVEIESQRKPVEFLPGCEVTLGSFWFEYRCYTAQMLGRRGDISKVGWLSYAWLHFYHSFLFIKHNLNEAICMFFYTTRVTSTSCVKLMLTAVEAGLSLVDSFMSSKIHYSIVIFSVFYLVNKNDTTSPKQMQLGLCMLRLLLHHFPVWSPVWSRDSLSGCPSRKMLFHIVCLRYT